MPELLPFLLLILFGGWVAMDGTSFGQFMVSRPLVAASLAGWIAGAPLQGAAVGLLLEALHLMVLPVGAARYPEAGPAAVASGGIYAAGPPTASALLTAVVFALLWESLSGESLRYLRQLNIRLATSAGSAPLTPAEIERRHLQAVALDFARGLLLVAGGMLLLSLLLLQVTPLWALGERFPRVVLTASLAGALAASLRLHDLRESAWLVGIGITCALLFLFLR